MPSSSVELCVGCLSHSVFFLYSLLGMGVFPERPSCVSTGNRTSFDRKLVPHTHTHASESGSSARLWPASSFINVDTQTQKSGAQLVRWSSVFHSLRFDYSDRIRKGQRLELVLNLGSMWVVLRVCKKKGGLDHSLTLHISSSLSSDEAEISLKAQRNFLGRCRSDVFIAQLSRTLYLLLFPFTHGQS